MPPGTGHYVPDPEKNPSLHAALKKFGKEGEGIPFKNGHPDFSAFVKRDANGKPIRVEIEMSGSPTDFTNARQAARDKFGDWSKGKDELGHTWHHEPDGVTMSLIDKKSIPPTRPIPGWRTPAHRTGAATRCGATRSSRGDHR